MKTTRIQIFIAVIVLLFFSLACEASVSTANISDAYMTNNELKSGQTDVFENDQTFYCIVEVSNAPDDTILKAVWTTVDVEGVEPGYLIDEVEITTDGKNEFTFDLKNDSLWPEGTYKVEIYMNGDLEKTLEFSVQ
ncbi:MAG: hypothetical protein RBT01_09800 [Anaerolineaceae bacterium]|jgi:hypothetical protein|nr:hypothetical protein [Anaerolineaceae bacterium]